MTLTTPPQIATDNSSTPSPSTNNGTAPPKAIDAHNRRNAVTQGLMNRLRPFLYTENAVDGVYYLDGTKVTIYLIGGVFIVFGLAGWALLSIPRTPPKAVPPTPQTPVAPVIPFPVQPPRPTLPPAALASAPLPVAPTPAQPVPIRPLPPASPMSGQNRTQQQRHSGFQSSEGQWQQIN